MGPWLRVVLLTAVVALPGLAWAGGDEAAARTHSMGAQKLFDQGSYQAAATAYEMAYKASPRPEYLYNLGQCHKRIKDLVHQEKALHALQSYLRAKPSAANKAEVVQEIEELKERIQILRATRPAGPTALNDILLLPTGQPAAAGTVPLYKKWWLWTAVGVIVAGAAVTAIVLSVPQDEETVNGTLTPGKVFFD